MAQHGMKFLADTNNPESVKLAIESVSNLIGSPIVNGSIEIMVRFENANLETARKPRAKSATPRAASKPRAAGPKLTPASK